MLFVRYIFFSLKKKKKKVAQLFILTEDELFFRLDLFSTDCLIRIQAAKTEKDQRILCSSRLFT